MQLKQKNIYVLYFINFHEIQEDFCLWTQSFERRFVIVCDYNWMVIQLDPEE